MVVVKTMSSNESEHEYKYALSSASRGGSTSPSVLGRQRGSKGNTTEGSGNEFCLS